MGKGNKFSGGSVQLVDWDSYNSSHIAYRADLSSNA